MTGGTSRADPALLRHLVRGAQRGDALATQELIVLLTPYVTRLVGPIALQDGPDAAQEALIAIFRGIGSVRDPDALFGWARTIAVREAVRVARRARRSVVAELDDVPAPGDPLLAADIADVLARLSPEHRAVLLLREVEGLSEERVSELLAIPLGTTKSRLSRARAGFQKAWSR